MSDFLQPGRASTPARGVVIIGAGPAGLALGYELKRRAVPFAILEQGATAGDSWRRMPTRLKLVSPWKTNGLPGTPRRLFPPHCQMGREEFHAYLQRYARDHALPIELETTVQRVEPTPSGFRIQTSRGEWRSRTVVNATGYFSRPFIPAIEGAGESAIRQLHVAGFGDAARVRETIGQGGRVLIVGKRLSAGQTMVELVDAGFEVSLSHRSPIRFGAGPVAWAVLFRIFPQLEWLKLRLRGASAPNNDVRMEGGRPRQLLRSGRVAAFPTIRHFERDAVVFENGARLRVDLVIYATGFRPALEHLRPLGLRLDAATGAPALRELESAEVPGLFFLGLDRGRNFRSRFLRGIREDAAFLAERIAARLASG
jgi:cation diffusion facilitator CzcD-associated flavoprotein CzcO